MPKGSSIDGSIEITLQGDEESMRLHVDVNSTVLNIKEVWREFAGVCRNRSLFCLFDGFLLEDVATLVGLGVVGGDTILLFGEGSPPDESKLIPLMKKSKRSAEEISVGLNVLFGEDERLEVNTLNTRLQIDYGKVLDLSSNGNACSNGNVIVHTEHLHLVVPALIL